MDAKVLIRFLALGLGASACDPFHAGFEDIEPASSYQDRALGPALPAPTSVVVMDWNVKFGGGRIDFFFDCFGDRVLMTEEEVLQNLEGLAEKIRQVDPDILLLQEVDVESKRSVYLDQVEWLLEHTSLRYGVYASQWRADYVPSDGIGPIDSGSAILSKWPLRDGERIALPLVEEQDALTRYFYLRRNLLRAKVDVAGRTIAVVATHTDAYGKDGTKKRHIDRFLEELEQQRAGGALVIGGGDLNTLPPGTAKQNEFSDSVCEDEDYIADDYRAEAEWLAPLYSAFNSAVPLALYQADNTLWFSHSVDGRGYWNRTLDYLYSNGEWQVGSAIVHQSRERGGLPTMPLSDHAPLSAVLELP